MSNYRPSLGQVPSEPKPPSIGELFGRMTAQISTLIRGEIELTKTKAMTFLNFAKAGIIALVIAGVFALYGLGWLLHSAELALALVLPAWAASLIVCGVIFLIVIIFALIGISKLKKSSQNVPAPQQGLKEDVDAVKKGAQK